MVHKDRSLVHNKAKTERQLHTLKSNLQPIQNHQLT